MLYRPFGYVFCRTIRLKGGLSGEWTARQTWWRFRRTHVEIDITDFTACNHFIAWRLFFFHAINRRMSEKRSHCRIKGL